MIREAAMAICVASLLVVGGWCVFSLCAGIVTYRSSMTRKGAVSGLRKNPDINAHSSDPLVMGRINEAKERWKRALDSGSIERLFVMTRDGIRLCGYYVAASGSRAVILVHGLRDSAAGMAYLAEEYHARGWNVLSVDLRAHGESGGSVFTMGVREGHDLSLWVDELVARFGSESVFLHGVSMGANAVLFYGADSRARSPVVKGIVVDSCFPSYRDTMVRLLTRIVGNRFVALSIACGASVASFVRSGVRYGRMDARPALGYDRRRRKTSRESSPARTAEAFRESRASQSCTRGNSPRALPVLAFHGGKDAIIPVQPITELFGSGVIPEAELVVIPEAPHIGAYFYERDRYLSKIDTFSRRFS